MSKTQRILEARKKICNLFCAYADFTHAWDPSEEDDWNVVPNEVDEILEQFIEGK
jgi:organic radical activating enzyme